MWQGVMNKMVDMTSFLITVFSLPFFLAFFLAIIFNIKGYLFFLDLKKYPKVRSKMLINSFSENPKYVGKMFEVLFSGLFSFTGLSKNKFDKYFEELYSYNLVKKIKNKKISNSIDFLKKIFRIILVILNIYLGFLLLVSLIVIIFFIIGIILLIFFKATGKI